jgi:hypothetical protein
VDWAHISGIGDSTTTNGLSASAKILLALVPGRRAPDFDR